MSDNLSNDKENPLTVESLAASGVTIQEAFERFEKALSETMSQVLGELAEAFQLAGIAIANLLDGMWKLDMEGLRRALLGSYLITQLGLPEKFVWWLIDRMPKWMIDKLSEILLRRGDNVRK